MSIQTNSTVDEESILSDDDILLNSRLVRKSRGDCSDMTLWRHIKAGIFPPPDVVINRQRYWRKSTVKKANSA